MEAREGFGEVGKELKEMDEGVGLDIKQSHAHETSCVQIAEAADAAGKIASYKLKCIYIFYLL